MRHLAIVTSFAALIACGGSSSADSAARDAGKAHVDEEDASAAVGGELDINSLLIAELVETEGSLLARCPCLVASGMYESSTQCMDAVGLGRKWVDCASGLDLSAYDDPQTREDLRCNIEDLRQRSGCLMGSVCTNSAVAMCMTLSVGCAQLPVALFSEFAVKCQVEFSR